MNGIAKYIISVSATIREALGQLNELSGDSLVLLVVDAEQKLLGTITDGDIRRGLIAGHELNETLGGVMHCNFMSLRDDEDLVTRLHELRERKIVFVPVLDKENKVVDAIDLRKQRSCLPLDVIIMAGGKGERLRPLTETTPKPLLKVGDKAIIDHNVDRLITYGVKNISVTVNYLKEQLEEHYNEPRNGIQVHCVREPRFLGTLGSIKLVDSFRNDTVLVMNSDLFTNLDYEDFYLHFKEHDADMSVAAVPYDVSVPYGILDLDGRNVKGVLEKPTYNYFANAGIYLIKKEMLDMIPNDVVFNATDLIELLVKNNKKVVRFPLNGTWIDIGNIQEYKRANEMVKYVK